MNNQWMYSIHYPMKLFIEQKWGNKRRRLVTKVEKFFSYRNRWIHIIFSFCFFFVDSLLLGGIIIVRWTWCLFALCLHRVLGCCFLCSTFSAYSTLCVVDSPFHVMMYEQFANRFHPLHSKRMHEFFFCSLCTIS